MLIIVNPYATTVSNSSRTWSSTRCRRASTSRRSTPGLRARDQIDATPATASTTSSSPSAPPHPEQGRQRPRKTDVPFLVLPGGYDMVCRTPGIPNDVVDATEHLIGIADDFRPRRWTSGASTGAVRLRLRHRPGRDRRRARRLPPDEGRRASRTSPRRPSRLVKQYLETPCGCRSSCPTTAQGRDRDPPNSDPFTFFGKRPCGYARALPWTTGRCVGNAAPRHPARHADDRRPRARRKRAHPPHLAPSDDHAETVTEALVHPSPKTTRTSADPGPGRRRLHRRLRGAPGEHRAPRPRDRRVARGPRGRGWRLPSLCGRKAPNVSRDGLVVGYRR